MADNSSTYTLGIAGDVDDLNSEFAFGRLPKANTHTLDDQTHQQLATSAESSEVRVKKRKREARERRPTPALPIPDEATPSSSASPSVQPNASRQALEEFFSWRPQDLQKDPRHSKSTSTREPQYFDMHLAEDLQLKNIVQVEDLADAISQVCNMYLSKNPAVYDIPPSGFPSPQKRSMTDVEYASIAGLPVSEKDVENAYKYKAAKFCSNVASTLAFDLDTWGPGLFTCRSRARLDYKVAKADALLDIDMKRLEELPLRHRENIALIAKYEIWHPVVWEFKSLTAGSEGTMEKLASLNGPFRWTTCRIGSRNKEDHCQHPQHTVDDEWSVTGRRTGPDSTTIWSDILQQTKGLEGTTEALSNFDLHEGKSINVVDFDDDVMNVNEEDDGSDNRDHYPFLESNSENSDPSSRNPAEEAYYSDDSTLTAVPSPQKRRRSLQTVQNYPADTELSLDDDEPEEIALQEEESQQSQTSEESDKCERIAQQGWAEAVINDATFIVFSSGNNEIHGVRHRASQTLYLSSRIDIANARGPAYGKLHTGLMLAGYRDALNRAIQLDRIVKLPKAIQPHLFSKLRFHPLDPYHKSMPGTDPATSSGGGNIKKRLVDQIYDGERTTMLLSPPLGMSGYPLKRRCFLKDAPPAGRPSGAIAKMHFALHKAITNKVFNVSLNQIEIRTGPRYAANFIMKLPVAKYLVPIYGLFDCSGEEDNLWALLMEDVGLSFSRLNVQRQGFAQFTENAYKFRTALSALHEAGYRHGSLDHHHLMMNKSCSVFFISLANCTNAEVTTCSQTSTSDPPERDQAAELKHLNKLIGPLEALDKEKKEKEKEKKEMKKKRRRAKKANPALSEEIDGDIRR
ncbi:hypothetical protein NLJ89_g8927 [Agrocybe chaxingu]|uniref:Uncharacterized protein n=1 Tax=Agrocybe chaxingu TaxID=84603 RepID=A0A9W8JTQ5_9AGAR|nr:hypothetical protein NLJ89_g8927 [Agrocybe chaxingu]